MPQATKSGRVNRVWYGSEKLRMAYYAGQGKSAHQIAEMVGGTTPQRVRGMLNAHELPLMRTTSVEDILFVRWKQSDRDVLEKVAIRLDRHPAELAALIIRKVLAGGDKAVEALVDKFDVLG